MTERSPRAAVAELTESCRLTTEHPVRRLALARPPRRSPRGIRGHRAAGYRSRIHIYTRAADIVVWLSRDPERNLHARDRTAASTVRAQFRSR